MGEVDLTAAIWRLDRNRPPSIEVIARESPRNAYSLGWDSAGTLFTVSNGRTPTLARRWTSSCRPRRESLRHHGFPTQMGDIPAESTETYPHTPEAPARMEFVLPS